MARKRIMYVREDGSSHEVFGRPVHGQVRFTAQSKTAANGETVWCVYDNEKDTWTNYLFVSAMCKTRSACEKMIATAIDKKQIPFVPYDDGTFKKGKHKFAVDVYWTVSRSFEVEAESREEAQKIIQAKVDAGDVCVWTDGFEATDDVEVSTSGEETNAGEIQYF